MLEHMLSTIARTHAGPSVVHFMLRMPRHTLPCCCLCVLYGYGTTFAECDAFATAYCWLSRHVIGNFLHIIDMSARTHNNFPGNFQTHNVYLRASTAPRRVECVVSSVRRDCIVGRTDRSRIVFTIRTEIVSILKPVGQRACGPPG